ncbi:MAG: glycoside hydrolase family 127 protein [Treponema sp.]|jgi:DUF1680 family protein|nr:glycoside hydrolase family 127 protein [Treponema sp.]
MDKSKFTNHLPLKDVTISDTFWGPIMERVRTQVIPYQWEALNDRIPGAAPSYSIRNFKLAAELTHPEQDYGVPRDIGFGGPVFQDSDAAKWIEAAAYTLVWHPDPALEKTLDDLIDVICNAQQSDGYLDTYYIVTGLEKRFTNLKDHHELYCFGHFLEGAIAYYEATGKRKLLDAIIRYAGCIDRNIGLEPGKLPGYPGHEVAEMALVKLYNITGDKAHLALAKYFIDQRGQAPLYFEKETERNKNDFYWKDSFVRYQYYQAGKPVRDQHTAEGHAVRAAYLYSGMADVAKATGDDSLLEACNNLFNNIAERQMYITGAIGQSAYGEMFTYDYHLPNGTAYAETCAAIGLAFFAKRMSAIAPRAAYADVLERALYNGIISGMSLDGKAFFYVNPLEVIPESCLKDRNCHHVKIERQKWFGCACCPPNLARITASLGSYIHSSRQGAIFTHLFIGSSAKFSPNGANVLVKLETRYPWEGKVEISFGVKEGTKFTYGLRVPLWCKKFSLSLNGADIPYKIEDGYALMDREWKDGDRLTVNFDMGVQFVRANPHVRENIGKTALTRGPVVYCLEEADNGKELFRLHTGSPGDINVKFEKDLLEGVTVIDVTGKREKDWAGGGLYGTDETVFEDRKLRFIPYYAWANRSAGEMAVWVNK